MAQMLIDPPSGWKYGFPKPIPSHVADHVKWLVDNGYPQELVEDFGDSFYCRYIMVPDADETATLEVKNETILR